MSTNNESPYDHDDDILSEDHETESNSQAGSGVGAWAISIGTHILVLLVSPWSRSPAFRKPIANRSKQRSCHHRKNQTHHLKTTSRSILRWTPVDLDTPVDNPVLDPLELIRR